MPNYFIATAEGQQEGPYNEDIIRAFIANGRCNGNTLVWCAGMSGWEPLHKHFVLSDTQQGAATPPPPPPPPFGSPAQQAGSSQNWSETGARLTDTFYSKAKNLKQASMNAADVASKATGLGKLDGFSFKEFCKEIFRKHTIDDIIDTFCCGTRKTTPSIQEINATWPAPWIFSRILVFLLVIYAGFSFGYSHFHNLNLIPGLLFVGCFAIPFCFCIFFFEMNLKRDMPFFEITKGFALGGIFSLIISLLFFEHLSLFNGAWRAGFIEEPAKLLATLFIASPMFRRGNVLHGMAIGCAVGAGFAAFETAGYVYRYMSLYDDLQLAKALGHYDIIGLSARLHDIVISFPANHRELLSNPQILISYLEKITDPYNVLWRRAIYTPFGHVIWTAITAGAYWHVLAKRKSEPDKAECNVDVSGLCNLLTFGLYKYTVNYNTVQDEEKFTNNINLRVFTDYRFLSIALCPMLLHAFWNTPLLQDWGIIRNIGIGVAGWALALLLVQMGIHQVKREKLMSMHGSDHQ